MRWRHALSCNRALFARLSSLSHTTGALFARHLFSTCCLLGGTPSRQQRDALFVRISSVTHAMVARGNQVCGSVAGQKHSTPTETATPDGTGVDKHMPAGWCTVQGQVAHTSKASSTGATPSQTPAIVHRLAVLQSPWFARRQARGSGQTLTASSSAAGAPQPHRTRPRARPGGTGDGFSPELASFRRLSPALDDREFPTVSSR